MYLAQNTTWYYRVIALTDLSTLAESNSAGATTFKLTRPTSPTHFKTTPTKNRITFTWTDNSDNETGFTLQRSTTGVGWATIAIVPANYTRCSYYVPSKYKFYYSISAFNSVGKSGNAAITTPVKSLVYSVRTVAARSSVFSTQPISDVLK